jgi:hypothetical protein
LVVGHLSVAASSEIHINRGESITHSLPDGTKSENLAYR